jgi:tetratricopeptide (TPR) repeat protein
MHKNIFNYKKTIKTDIIIKHKNERNIMHTETISSVYYKPTRAPKAYSTESSSQANLELSELWAFLEENQEKLNLAEKEGRLEDMLLILNDLTDCLPSQKSSPAFPLALFAKMDFLFKKSIVHEKLGQIESALDDLEEAAYLKQEDVQSLALEPHYNHYILRKSALLLTLGKQDEAIEILRNHQPNDVATVLLYRFLEQKLDISILQKTRPVEQSDQAKSLFMAGQYEQAELLLKGNPDGQLLRADCLTMLGRIDEARELRTQELEDKPYLEDESRPEYCMLLILQDDVPNPLPWDYDAWEQFYHFPLRAFWNLSNLSN